MRRQLQRGSFNPFQRVCRGEWKWEKKKKAWIVLHVDVLEKDCEGLIRPLLLAHFY